MEAGVTLPPEAGIYHLGDNVAEWAIKISLSCKEPTCYDGWPTSEQAQSGFMGGSFEIAMRSIDTFVPWRPDNEELFIGFRCVAGPYVPPK